MDDTLLFIPPCCVDQKLPKAVMQASQRCLCFYTHGDVTMEKFYRAVGHLLIDPHVMVLSMSVVASETMAFLCQCFDRGWITALVLSVRRDCATLLDKYLSGYKDRILCACSKDVSEISSHMVLYNNERSLYINGPMYEQPQKVGLVAYTMQFLPSYSLLSNNLDWGNPLRNILFPDVLRHRAEMRKQKKEVTHPRLSNFIHCEFPPYKEDNI